MKPPNLVCLKNVKTISTEIRLHKSNCDLFNVLLKLLNTAVRLVTITDRRVLLGQKKGRKNSYPFYSI